MTAQNASEHPHQTSVFRVQRATPRSKKKVPFNLHNYAVTCIMCIVFLPLVCLGQKITRVLIAQRGLFGLRVRKGGLGERGGRVVGVGDGRKLQHGLSVGAGLMYLTWLKCMD